LDILLFYGYEFLSAFLPFMALFFLLSRKGNFSISKISYMMLIIFSVYIIAVYHFTGAGTLQELHTFQLKINRYELNLIPFSNEIDIVGYLLNILLLVPFGILVPFLWGKMNHFRYIAETGLLFSFFIECSQLLNNRSTDVDDLIMNTIGAVIGLMLYRIFDKLTKSNYQRKDIPVFLMAVSILIPFLGRFLFFNEMGLAHSLYGF